MARPVRAQERLRGWRCSGFLFGDRPCEDSRVLLTRGHTRHNGWRGGVLSPHARTVVGMASEWRGRSHRVDGDGGDRSRWPDVTAPPRAVAEQSCVFPSRALPSLFEGAVCRPYESGWYSATG
jgi:hypothetical protein